MSLPLVSVVIPAQNAEAWISETLASVLAQTYPHSQLEIIVVDDGSTDATVELARRSLAASDIAYRMMTTQNGGPSAARNVGWRAARGEWIQFLDADDVLEPDKIEFQARAAETAAANTAGIFSEWGRLYLKSEGWVQHPDWVRPFVNQDALMDLLRPDNFIHLGSQLLRRDRLERVGGFVEAYTLIEDVDLELRLVMQDARLQAVRAGRPLFWYRQRTRSLSRTDPIAFVNGCARNARFVEMYWRGRNELTPERVDFLTACYFGQARALAQDAPQDFDCVLSYLYGVNPNFVPTTPAMLKWLTRGFGYRRAERIAIQFRQLKRLAKGERQVDEGM